MRALIITSVASMIDQFNMPNINLLKSLGYEVDVACNFIIGNTCSDERVEMLKGRLTEIGVKYFQIDFARDVTKIGENVKSYSEIKKLLAENAYDLIHCQSPIGGMLTRMAAKKYRKNGTRVVYTAHGFHFYKGAPKLNWMIYYPIEKMCAKWTDELITINREDYEFARQKMNIKDIQYVPGVGINTENFEFGILNETARYELRTRLGIGEDEKMVLVNGDAAERAVNEKIASMADGNPEEAKQSTWKVINADSTDESFSNLCDCADLYVSGEADIKMKEAIAAKTPALTIEELQIGKTPNVLKAFNVLKAKELKCEEQGDYVHLNILKNSQRKRKELGIPLDANVFFSVGELNKNKNHQIVVEALAGEKTSRENHISRDASESEANANASGKAKDVYIIAGQGALKDELAQLAKNKNVDLRLLGFRQDVAELLHMADYYVHPSLREGLSVALMEALAAMTTCITSDIRGSRDLTSHTFKDLDGLKKLIREDKEDYYFNCLGEQFRTHSVLELLAKIYGGKNGDR